MFDSTAVKSILLFSLYYASVVSAAVFTVGVGKDETTGRKGIGFDPSVIMPSAGDQIVFEFRSGVHSVVESTFEDPCTPKPGGFNGGVHTVADDLDVDATGLPTVTLLVNDSQPLWQAGGKCYLGGVLAANPTSSQTAAGFKENASKAGSAPVNATSTSSNTPAQTAPASSPNTNSNSAVGFVLDRVVASALGLGLLGMVTGIF
ncbi:hypothetical protein WG66_014696 [Moniliophthora roreri]|uniref:Extracellular serine-rich protein n=2 Tax=Moniliophthora roreri TaxID=221103 RepID=A0A0W0ETK5_MONRR|nr:hypothetical protein WG66_014696 [Moniliophthora roreri]